MLCYYMHLVLLAQVAYGLIHSKDGFHVTLRGAWRYTVHMYTSTFPASRIACGTMLCCRTPRHVTVHVTAGGSAGLADKDWGWLDLLAFPRSPSTACVRLRYGLHLSPIGDCGIWETQVSEPHTHALQMRRTRSSPGCMVWLCPRVCTV